MYGPSRPEVHRMHREAAQPPNPNRGGIILNMENGSSCPLPSCPDRYGTLPSCAGLSVPYVPFQQEGSQKYSQSDALSNGTLFPGLNLPFRLKVEGSTVPVGPLAELQALEFVVAELGMYLDTHPSDQEALRRYGEERPGDLSGQVWPSDPERLCQRGELPVAQGALALELCAKRGEVTCFFMRKSCSSR